MNIKSLTLTIISLAALGLAVSQPAQAKLRDDMSSGADSNSRFHFAPQQWQAETMKPIPHVVAGPPVNVRSGAVPSRGIFGIDPTFLAKAPPPTAFSTVARPVMTREMATPKLLPQPKVQAKFNPAFGQSANLAPPLVAQVPVGLPAIPTTARPSAASKSLSGRLVPRHGSSARVAVAGRLIPHSTPVPQIANYGNMGFSQGAFTPAASGSGFNSNSNVHGVVLNRRQH